MAEGETGVEPTIEISAGEYPEITKIIASGGDVDRYLEGAGIAPEVAADDTCVRERTALGGSLAYVVEAVGGAAGGRGSTEPMTVTVSAAASLLGSLSQVTNDGLQLAECLDQQRSEAAAAIRETFELVSLDDDRLRRAIDELSAGT